MRFRAIGYATTNPVRTTIALGTTGAVALGAATSLKEILHLRYISFLLPLKKKPDDSDLLTIQEATQNYLHENNVSFSREGDNAGSGSFGWYAKFLVEVKSLAAAENAQRTIETCLLGDAKPLLGDAADLTLEGTAALHKLCTTIQTYEIRKKRKKIKKN